MLSYWVYSLTKWTLSQFLLISLFHLSFLFFFKSYGVKIHICFLSVGEMTIYGNEEKSELNLKIVSCKM